MDQEITVLLQKILDQLQDNQQVATNHVLIPSISVPTTQIMISVNTFILLLTAKNSDIKVNFNRQITEDEYVIIPQDTYLEVNENISTIYAQSLNTGGELTIIGLKK